MSWYQHHSFIVIEESCGEIVTARKLSKESMVKDHWNLKLYHRILLKLDEKNQPSLVCAWWTSTYPARSSKPGITWSKLHVWKRSLRTDQWPKKGCLIDVFPNICFPLISGLTPSISIRSRIDSSCIGQVKVFSQVATFGVEEWLTISWQDILWRSVETWASYLGCEKCRLSHSNRCHCHMTLAPTLDGSMDSRSK